jgi:hypothetical protein
VVHTATAAYCSEFNELVLILLPVFFLHHLAKGRAGMSLALNERPHVEMRVKIDNANAFILVEIHERLGIREALVVRPANQKRNNNIISL